MIMHVSNVLILIISLNIINLLNGFFNSQSNCKISKLQLYNNINPKNEIENSKLSLRKNIFSILSPLAFIAVNSITNAKAAEYYLIEPTKEFKDEEEKVLNYKKQQLKIRKDWDIVIEKLVKSEEPSEIESNLKSLTSILKALGDIPSGVKRTELVKTCRSKKFNGKKIKSNWTTDVEIAYQALIQTFNRLLNPDNAGSVLRL